MEKTIDQMKVGERLYLGQYGVTNDEHPRIAWLKASPNCDFISEFALDYIQFDARETGRPTRENEFFAGNPRFAQSNINQFLNSEEDEWWSKKTEYNRPPESTTREHFGFLYWFSDYELESIVKKTYELDNTEVLTKMRLPLFSEVIGTSRLQLFKRKGIRPKANQMYYFNAFYGFDENSYVDFWCMDRGDERAYAIYTIDRTGYADRRSPYQRCGLRPMCTMKPDTVISNESYGEMINGYAVKPFATAPLPVFSDDELINLLGMALP